MVSSKEFSSFGNRLELCGVTAYRSPIALAVQNLGWVIWHVIPREDSSFVVVVAVVFVVVVVLLGITEAGELIVLAIVLEGDTDGDDNDDDLS